ncbi:hypothetical protein WMY93_003927 [Mugilogobius chulae]|uniref:Uncharacterized protein n=1 Tax=Mugilogobius chulae TaxID=88201 RepID=A0AAW0PY37_9GOBI
MERDRIGSEMTKSGKIGTGVGDDTGDVVPVCVVNPSATSARGAAKPPACIHIWIYHPPCTGGFVTRIGKLGYAAPMKAPWTRRTEGTRSGQGKAHYVHNRLGTSRATGTECGEDWSTQQRESSSKRIKVRKSKCTRKTSTTEV